MCKVTYETEFEFREHMLFKHRKENSTACKCDKHLRDLPAVIMHRITEHPEPKSEYETSDKTINSEKDDHKGSDVEDESHITDNIMEKESEKGGLSPLLGIKTKEENAFPVKEDNDDFTYIRQTNLNEMTYIFPSRMSGKKNNGDERIHTSRNIESKEETVFPIIRIENEKVATSEKDMNGQGSNNEIYSTSINTESIKKIISA